MRSESYQSMMGGGRDGSNELSIIIKISQPNLIIRLILPAQIASPALLSFVQMFNLLFHCIIGSFCRRRGGR